MRKGKDQLIKSARMARTGTNYWALKKACSKIDELKNNPSALKLWTENEIERYTKYASPKWATVVKKTYEIVLKNT